MQILASLANDEETFNKRVNLIEQYKDDLTTLMEEIELLQQNKPSILNLSLEEQQICLSIPAFLDSVSLFQQPSLYKDVFDNKHVAQAQVNNIYEIAKPLVLEDQNLVSVFQTTVAYSRARLYSYFSDFAKVLQEIDKNLPMILNDARHVVFLRYDLRKQKWIFSDINFITIGAVVKELSAEELVENIFSAFFDEKKNVVFNLQAFSLSKLKRINQESLEKFKRKYPLTKKLARTYDSNSSSALYMACLAGDYETVAKLLATGANPKKTLKNKFSPLHIAVHNNFLDIVKLLIKHLSQSDLDLRDDKDGGTPFLIACRWGHIDIARLLIENRINIKLADNSGNYPQHYVANYNHITLLPLLLDNGADINIVNEEGKTPLYLAVANGHLEMVQALINANADVNFGERVPSPVYKAIENGDFKIFMALVAAGANIEQIDANGDSYLSLAIQFQDYQIAKELINAKVKLNFQNIYGYSPLFLLIRQEEENLELVELILANGADLELKDTHEQSAIDVAMILGKLDVVKILLHHAKLNNLNVDKIMAPDTWEIIKSDPDLFAYLAPKTMYPIYEQKFFDRPKRAMEDEYNEEPDKKIKPDF